MKASVLELPDESVTEGVTDIVFAPSPGPQTIRALTLTGMTAQGVENEDRAATKAARRLDILAYKRVLL